MLSVLTWSCKEGPNAFIGRQKLRSKVFTSTLHWLQSTKEGLRQGVWIIPLFSIWNLLEDKPIMGCNLIYHGVDFFSCNRSKYSTNTNFFKEQNKKEWIKYSKQILRLISFRGYTGCFFYFGMFDIVIFWSIFDQKSCS